MKVSMNPRDQIAKAAWTLMDSVKRSITENVEQMVRTGNLKIDKKAVPGLIYVLHAAVEAGMAGGRDEFFKKVDLALDKNVVENKRSKIRTLLGIKEK